LSIADIFREVIDVYIRLTRFNGIYGNNVLNKMCSIFVNIGKQLHTGPLVLVTSGKKLINIRLGINITL